MYYLGNMVLKWLTILYERKRVLFSNHLASQNSNLLSQSIITDPKHTVTNSVLFQLTTDFTYKLFYVYAMKCTITDMHAFFKCDITVVIILLFDHIKSHDAQTCQPGCMLMQENNSCFAGFW